VKTKKSKLRQQLKKTAITLAATRSAMKRQFSERKFAKFVRATREQREMSLRQTARKAGITLARVVAIESGINRLSVPQLCALAHAFHFKSGGEMLLHFERQSKLVERKATPRKKSSKAAAVPEAATA
jgi:transcriptional regulator with XRE-family HTH domain